jgi:beta-carotene 3-hydroxylase
MSANFINIIAFTGAYLGMEFVAWSNHKYIMHGFGWFLHKSHHVNRGGWWEWNDVYFVIYAAISMGLCYAGWENLDYRFWMGCGVAAYGFTYFLLHDIFIHSRIKLFRKVRWRYFEAMKRAHKIHHKHLGKEHGEEFGMLIFNKKYFKILDAKSLFEKQLREK